MKSVISLFIVFLLFAFYGTPRVMGVDPGVYQVPLYQAPQVYQRQFYAPPQTIFLPRIEMVPYNLQRSEVSPIQYPTPIRDLLFGRYRIKHYYVPQSAYRNP